MKAVSLFSGCGGMDMGVENAGFENLLSVDIDKNACLSLNEHKKNKNLKNKTILNADITKINPLDYVKPSIDLLHAGPPCQSFSIAGKRRSLKDERGQLIFEILRFANLLKPKVLLIEEVKGLLSASNENEKKGSVFSCFIQELETLGYECKWSVLLAANFGIPQLRERLFLIATLGKNKFVFPPQTHYSPLTNLDFFQQKQYVTVGEVISDLPPPQRKDGFERIPNHVDVTPKRDAERISYVSEGSYLANSVYAPPEIIKRLTKKDTTKFKRLHRDEPSLTLRGGEIFYHPTENRYLTPREYMRIHLYPDDFRLQGPIKSRSGTYKELDQHRLISNSVPPFLAEIVAKEIRKVL